MRILITTDSFPPGCGGSGWSTYELARELRARGHEVIVFQPEARRTPPRRTYEGFEVRSFSFWAPSVPFARNYFKSELLHARLALVLGQMVIDERIDLVHAQHVMTIPGAVQAARRAGVPSVATILSPSFP